MRSSPVNFVSLSAAMVTCPEPAFMLIVPLPVIAVPMLLVRLSPFTVSLGSSDSVPFSLTVIHVGAALPSGVEVAVAYETVSLPAM